MVAFARFATRVVLGAVSLALSRALLEVAHLYGWYPERQLAQLVTHNDRGCALGNRRRNRSGDLGRTRLRFLSA